MPSLLVRGAISGGVGLVSGDIFSGSPVTPQGGIQFKLDRNAPGPVYIGVRRHYPPPDLAFSGQMIFSGAITIASGGDLSSGGLADGMPIDAGDAAFIPRIAFPSGIQDIRLAAPAASSGGRLYWDWY